MKILRATHMGMCFGVRDAISLAMRESARTPVTILGDLVHNETVMESLRQRGVEVRTRVDEVQTATAIITAHGASEKALRHARQSGLHVVEATCPLVRTAHRAVQQLVAAGFYPVIIGKRGHVEVRGLTEDFAEYSIVLTEADAAAVPNRPKIGIAAQTTQPIDRVRQLAGLISDLHPGSEVRFVDTVCQPTKLRQNAALDLARRSDVVIVVGGRVSNNTRELVETCRKTCSRVHHVESSDDLRNDWFYDSDVVGITAGTSTPDSVIDGVELWVRRQIVVPAREFETACPA